MNILRRLKAEKDLTAVHDNRGTVSSIRMHFTSLGNRDRIAASIQTMLTGKRHQSCLLSAVSVQRSREAWQCAAVAAVC
jgi:hypothetical protein